MQNNTTTYSLKIEVGEKEVNRSISAVISSIDKLGEKIDNLSQSVGTTLGQNIYIATNSLNFINNSLDTTISSVVNLNKELSVTAPLIENTTKVLTESGEKATKSFWKRIEDWLTKSKKALNETDKEFADSYKRSTEAITSIMDVYKEVMKYEIGVLKESLKETSEELDAITAKKKESAQSVLQLNKQIEESQQNLSLKSVYMTKMQRKEEQARVAELRANLEAEQKDKQAYEIEEQRLQAEKEEQKKKIAEKEKKQKKIELGQSMVKATANTAESVTKMLALMWPLNLVMAAMVAGMGAAQIGIIGRQMSKLKDGGILDGPSHTNGGMQILGSNIEVEGGEYVINKTSTANNRALLDYINGSSSTVTANELLNRQGIPTSRTGQSEIAFTRTSTAEERLLNAIEKINLSPVVSVVDIIDTQKNITSVRDMAGY